MKALAFIRFGLLLSVSLLFFACESADQSHETRKGQMLTGSYIPQNVQKNGQIYNGASDLKTVDQTDAKNTGASTPADLLRRQGVVP